MFRVFRPTIHPGKEGEFESFLRDTARPLVAKQSGLRPMHDLETFRSARTLGAGHAFVQNLRRGHYEIAVEEPTRHRLRAAFDQLTVAIQRSHRAGK
jgi:hypothetical protein